MAGIAGGIGTGLPDAAAALAATARRGGEGPAATALHQEGPVALGQARSALPSAGRPPAVDAATGVAVVLDGTVYNRADLRSRLGPAADGADGDAGLLAAGLAREGAAFLDGVNGIYSLAWWDPRDGRLRLARDPAGVKSLHVAPRPGGLLFASEVKALLPSLGPVRLDGLGLAAYLRYHFVPAEETVVAGVRRLRQGTAILVDAEGRQVGRRETRPWPKPPLGPVDAAQVWAWLRATMERQVEPGLPAGVFLSGGIDSSVVAALATQVATAPVHTWTIGFDILEGQPRDERGAAEDLARRLGTIHESILLTGSQVAQDIASIAWDFDGPLGEGGAVPTWYAARAARPHVPVVFIGEGSDSLFAGGGQYKAQMRFERWSRWVPHGDALATLAGRLLPGKAAGAARGTLRRTPSERYSAIFETFLPEHLKAAGLPRPGLPALQPGWTFMDLDRHALLPDNYYVKIDMCCGAHGLEGRVPYTDLELAARCDPLPVALKVGPPEKKILREAATPHLGGAALRKKQGYSTPLLAWSNGALAPDVAQALDDPAAVRLGLLSAAQWACLRKRTGAEGLHPQRRRWMLFGLDLWLRGVERRGLSTER